MTTEKFPCGECGMPVTPTEYHPLEYCRFYQHGIHPRTKRTLESYRRKVNT